MRPRYGNLSAFREVIAACLQKDWCTHTDVEVFRTSFLLLWKTLVDTFDLRLLIEVHDESPGAGAEPEGGGGARPTLFAPNTLKSPLNWPKKSWGRAPEPPAPPLFSNPGSAPVEIWIWMIVPKCPCGPRRKRGRGGTLWRRS